MLAGVRHGHVPKHAPRIEDGRRHEKLAGEAFGQGADELQLPPEGVLIATKDFQAVKIVDLSDHPAGRRRARVAVVVHDLHKVEVVGLDVSDVGLDGRRSGQSTGTEMVPKRQGRPVRLASFEDGSDALNLIHGPQPPRSEAPVFSVPVRLRHVVLSPPFLDQGFGLEQRVEDLRGRKAAPTEGKKSGLDRQEWLRRRRLDGLRPAG